MVIVNNKMLLRGITYDPTIANKLVKWFDVDAKVKAEDGKLVAVDFPTIE
jgi:hypothetical protein